MKWDEVKEFLVLHGLVETDTMEDRGHVEITIDGRQVFIMLMLIGTASSENALESIRRNPQLMEAFEAMQ